MSENNRTMVTRPRGIVNRDRDRDARTEVRAWRGVDVRTVLTVETVWTVAR